MGNKSFTDSFAGIGPGHVMLIKPGEVVQYTLEMSGANSGVGTVILEYSTDGGAVYKQAYATDDSAVSYTGTVADPLLALETLGWIKNEGAKNRLYRWRCTAYTQGYSEITCSLKNHLQPKSMIADGVYVYVDDSAPEGGTDGDGAQLAGEGSIYIDTSSTGAIYRNDGTARMPVWVSL